MKLFWCPDCYDIVLMVVEHTRYCRCGKHCGKYYSNKSQVVLTEGAVPLNIRNESFAKALRKRRQKDEMVLFKAGVMPWYAPTVTTKKCGGFI